MSGPDAARAIEKYRRHAAGYDATAARTMALRQRTIGFLALRPGDVVLDVACGTGLSFPLLREGVGPTGKVIGVELSPEMAAQARARMESKGWKNVVLMQAAMEDAPIEDALDAILFNYTHDVLRSPAALERIFACARPDAHIAVAGVKHPPWWLFPARLWRLANARPYLTTFEGLDRPWSLLERYTTGLEITPVLWGTNYIGSGRAARIQSAFSAVNQ